MGVVRCGKARVGDAQQNYVTSNRAGPSKIPYHFRHGTLGQRGCRVTAKRGVVWGPVYKGVASNALDRENQGIHWPWTRRPPTTQERCPL